MSHRFSLLFIAFLLWFGAVLARLYYWQIIKSPELVEIARAQYERPTTQSLPRGKILSSDGYPLALNEDRYRLIVKPNVLKDPPALLTRFLVPLVYTPSIEAATDSAKRLLEEKTLEAGLLSKMSDASRKWVPLASGLRGIAKQEIEKLGNNALTFETYQTRYYPESTLSAHVLGFVGSDERGEPKGYFGIEGQYDLELRGKQTNFTQMTDAVGQPISLDVQTEAKDASSRDLTLTITRDIQFMLERHLQAGLVKYGAKSIDALIMESKTGKILAMASYPSYIPSEFAKSDPTVFKNPTIADSYEPGSTFKVLTVATGIDTGVITPDTRCDSCAGPVTIGRYTIKTWNNEYQAERSIQEGLTRSDNTVMVFTAKKIGKEKFLEYIKAFGIGEQTDIDLQEESSPKLRPDKDWGEIDVATASFGQGIALTGIQMLASVNAIANGGVLMRPYVVDTVTTGQASFQTKPKEVRRVIKPETARIVTQMMMEAASKGDARWTLPKSYPIAGKTGTAQIPLAGEYADDRTIASFVGFAPAQDPKFTMLVRVVEPTSSPWGSETAAPLWFTIAKDLFVKFGVSPNKN